MPPAWRSVRRSPSNKKLHSATNNGALDCINKPLIAVVYCRA